MRTTKLLPAILLLVFILPESFSQQIARQSINSFGRSTVTNELRISETVGQPYVTTAQRNGSLLLHPGFQQQMLAGKKEIAITGDQMTIEFYPNPASSFLQIVPSGVIPEARIIVVDMNGRVISETEYARLENTTMDVSGWPSGLYTFRIVRSENLEASSARILIIK